MEMSFLVDCLDFEQMFSTLTDVGFVGVIIFHFTDVFVYDNQSKIHPCFI